MADIKLQQQDFGFDVGLSGPDLLTDEGLETAVIVSLFTDRLASDDDRLPNATGNKRGWWADTFPQTEGDLIGSKLWLLSREKQTPETVNRAIECAQEALQWLIDDGVASAVEVSGFIPRTGMLGLEISILRDDGPNVDFRYDNIWEAMNAL